MRFIYKEHLLVRLKQRNIPKIYPQLVINEPEQEYYDTVSKRPIVIKKLFYRKKLRNMVVAYDIIENNIEVVTIHAIEQPEIENKLRRGRWIIYEKN